MLAIRAVRDNRLLTAVCSCCERHLSATAVCDDCLLTAVVELYNVATAALLTKGVPVIPHATTDRIHPYPLGQTAVKGCEL